MADEVRTNPPVNRESKRSAYRFDTLKDQRLDQKEVRIPISRDELAKVADEVTSLINSIDEKEKLRKETLPQQIKEMQGRLSVAARIHSSRSRPQIVDVAIGFDYDDKEPIPAATPNDTPLECPLGKKWFVNTRTGDVYGPEPVTEQDMQVVAEALQATPATVVEGNFNPEVIEGGKGDDAAGEESDEVKEKGARTELRDTRKKTNRKPRSKRGDAPVAAEPPPQD